MTDEPGSPLIGFLVVDQRPADAIRFPGDFTQLAPRGQGSGIAERWNDEHLAAVILDHNARWDELLAEGAEPAEPNQGPSEAKIRQVYDAALEAWTADRDDAFARRGSEFGTFEKLQWGKEHPRPTVEQIYEAEFGRPYPGHRKAEPSPRRPPDPPSGARVEELDSAWCARMEWALEEEFERVLAESGPLPRRELSRLISELMSGGWTVVHWTDDRRLIHDELVSRTEITGVSVVMQRV